MPSWGETILSTLFEYQQQGLLCDLDLSANDGSSVGVHSCLLGAVSPVMLGDLASITDSSMRGSVTFDCSPAALQSLVRVVYTGELDLSSENCSEVSSLISQMGLPLPDMETREQTTLKPESTDNEHQDKSYQEQVDADISGVTDNDQMLLEVKEHDKLMYDQDANVKEEQCSAGEQDTDSTTVTDVVESTDEQQMLRTSKRKRRITEKYSKHLQSLSKQEEKLKGHSDHGSGASANSLKQISSKKRKLKTITVEITKESDAKNEDIAVKVEPATNLEVPEDIQTPATAEDRKSFLKKKSRRAHFSMPTTSVCPTCGLSLSTPSSLKKHIRAVHLQLKPYKCSFCSTSFKKMDHLRSHEARHVGKKPHLCQFCGRGYADEYDKTIHQKMCIKNPEMNEVHGILESEKTCEISSDQAPADMVGTHENPNKCTLCLKVLTNAKALAKHHEIIHKGVRPYKCRHCPKTFGMRSAWVSHEYSHTGEKPYICKYCANGYRRRYDKNAHEQKCKNNPNADIHVKVKEEKEPQEKHLCDTCGALLSTVQALRSHEKRVHLNIRPYPCEICNFRFKKNGHLQDHIRRVHKGEKPFVCQFCSNRFTTAAALRYHENRHAGIEPPKKFKCGKCDMRFMSAATVKVHERKHSGARPFECPYCPKRFQYKQGLNIHVRIHTGERPYQCKVENCGKDFRSRNTLVTHQLCHTDEKNYKCKYCGAAYKHRSKLHSHVLRKHNEGGRTTANRKQHQPKELVIIKPEGVTEDVITYIGLHPESDGPVDESHLAAETVTFVEDAHLELESVNVGQPGHQIQISAKSESELAGVEEGQVVILVQDIDDYGQIQYVQQHPTHD